MSNGILRTYGKYSYGLYVFHGLFHDVLKNLLFPHIATLTHNSVINGLGYFAICLLLLTLLSVASYKLYERPFLLLKNRFA